MYRLACRLVRLVYSSPEFLGTENLPEEPAVIVGNHCQMNGPIIFELFPPRRGRTWCAGEMMDIREVPDYAFRDFWSRKPWWNRWFFRLASYLIAPLASAIFNNAYTIPVYRDQRVLTTFRRSVQALEAGEDVVIFPEKDEPYNHILWQFQERFVDLARSYYRRSGKAAAFVPCYIAPRLKKVVLGAPIRFDPAAPIEGERERIRSALMEAITRMAEELPEHVVVPYPNLPKSAYPVNRSPEVKEP